MSNKRYKLRKDYQTPGCFLPAGTLSTQMTEAEYETNGVPPELRQYGENALYYFKFKNLTIPFPQKCLDGWPDFFEEIKPERIEVQIYPKGDYGKSELHLCYFGTSKELSEMEILAVKSAIYNVLNGISTLYECHQQALEQMSKMYTQAPIFFENHSCHSVGTQSHPQCSHPVFLP